MCNSSSLFPGPATLFSHASRSSCVWVVWWVWSCLLATERTALWTKAMSKPMIRWTLICLHVCPVSIDYECICVVLGSGGASSRLVSLCRWCCTLWWMYSKICPGCLACLWPVSSVELSGKWPKKPGLTVTDQPLFKSLLVVCPKRNTMLLVLTQPGIITKLINTN